MLKIFKKLLGKPDAPAVPPRVAAAPQAMPESLPPMPQVEVAHLSLAAIMQKLPEDLKKTIAHIPDESVTVALPLATIQKQLPTGSVKMSLASLYRQAPSGTFTHARTEDRRMVEVPLSEIFRHVSPNLLPRREQRRLDLPEDSVALFGDSSNPYSIAPAVPDEPLPAPKSAPAPVPQPQRVIKPPLEMRTPVPPPVATTAPAQPRTPVPKATPRAATPPAGFTSPAPATPTATPTNEEPLVIPLATLAGDWPEPIRSEAFSLIEAKVALPAGAVTSGLARGKVSFTWGQLRSWLTPPVPSPTQAPEAMELLLPLKVVAPAFLAHSKPTTPRKSVAIDETIPALFSGAAPVEPPAPTPVPIPEPEPVPVIEEQQPVAAEADPAPPAPTVLAPPVELQAEVPATPAPQPEEEVVVPAPEPAATIPAPAEVETVPLAPPVEPQAEVPATPAPQPEEEVVVPAPEPAATIPAPAEVETVPSTPTVLAPPVELRTEIPAAPAQAPAEEAVVSAPEPAAAIPAPAEVAPKPKPKLGEILGNPDKAHWSPPELVKATVGLPGVAGAVVALQEGLLVAADLPEAVKGDTVAAFLPQIFARLTNYAGEMKLGAVEDILFTTNGAHFQIFRLGEVYFAVLGKPGETLPWESLRLITEELAHHHQK